MKYGGPRVAPVTQYLSEIGHQLDIDYRSLPIQPGDTFLLATDGIHEHLDERTMAGIIRESGDDLDAAARRLAAQALERGSDDNLTAQIIRVNSVPAVPESSELFHQLAQLPFAPELQPGQHLDGYRILRQIHASSRSHVYLAVDEETDTRVVLKMPSLEQRHDPVYLEQFSTEQWIARRISSAHVARPFQSSQRPSFLYQATEFVEGCTLRQWMLDNPAPTLDTVRDLVEQIGKGLRAFHRLEMVHQDLKPENIMLDRDGRVKILDFGTVLIAGADEMVSPLDKSVPQGSVNYVAPEYLVGEPGSFRADLFSLAVIVYEMLTGELPFKESSVKRVKLKNYAVLEYIPAQSHRPGLPLWVEGCLRKALQPNPRYRYDAFSEFLKDLTEPNSQLEGSLRQRPLIERNPLLFWKLIALFFLLLNLLQWSGLI